MADLERFGQHSRRRGVLVDTNLLVLLIVGSVNRDRIPRFKRTSGYTSADWDLLTGILGQIPNWYTLPHVLAETSALTDLKGPELGIARDILNNTISLMVELPGLSADACGSPHYRLLGLTDAAIALAAKRQDCSVFTNDLRLYRALLDDGITVAIFDHFRRFL